MGRFKAWLMELVLMLLEFERDDASRPARDRMRWARWHRVMKRKAETGRGVIRVDREGVAYPPAKRIVLKAKT